MKKLLTFFCLIIFCISTGKVIYWTKKGFSLRRVQGVLRDRVESWDENANPALSQAFYYLGRGRQCFAFSSRDGKYVLKLPRSDIYAIPFWRRAFSLASTKNIYDEKQRRKQFILNSFHIAHEELREETGTLALHLGATPCEGRYLELVDSVGSHFRLSADRTAFILQTKQPILMAAFLDALHNHDREEAKRILESFLDLIWRREKKGIGNKDGSFLRNYGFDGRTGYQIDIGSFYYRTDEISTLADALHPVRAWLTKTDPEMLAIFNQWLDKIHK